MRSRYLCSTVFGLALSACSADPPTTSLVGPAQATPDGQAPSNPSGDGGNGPSVPTKPGEPGDPSLCERLDAVARPVIPRMLVLADRSSSMTQSTSASACPPCFESRWDGSVKAIKDVTKALDSVIDFGLMLFPTAGLGSSQDVACVAGDVSVQAAQGTSRAIAVALDDANPGGATPTAKALTVAKRVLIDDVINQPDPDPRPSYVLLVTDGEPTCEDKDQGVVEPDATHTALDSLLSAGVPTYVIGYGIAGILGPGATMDAMAMHGGTGKYYPAEGQTELVAALNAIASSVVSCDFELENEPPRGDEFIQVRIDGKNIAFGDQGWTRNARFIRMRGPACELLRDGEAHDIEIIVQCEPVTII